MSSDYETIDGEPCDGNGRILESPGFDGEVLQTKVMPWSFPDKPLIHTRVAVFDDAQYTGQGAVQPAPGSSDLGHQAPAARISRVKAWWAALGAEGRAKRASANRLRRAKTKYAKMVVQTRAKVRSEAIKRGNDPSYAKSCLRSYTYCRRFLFCNAPLYPNNPQLAQLRDDLAQERLLGGPGWEALWNKRVARRELAVQRKLLAEVRAEERAKAAAIKSDRGYIRAGT